MPSKYWKDFQSRIAPEDKQFARKLLDLVDALHLALDRLELSQKYFANVMGKSESEISKWLSPGHNFTLKSIAKIEAQSGIDLLQTKLRFEAHYEATAEN